LLVINDFNALYSAELGVDEVVELPLSLENSANVFVPV
jgi:hypothetical protein